MCRKRGRIVLVGVTGLELSRADFFEKELSFQVSCSYGPGRYDPEYEDKGQRACAAVFLDAVRSGSASPIAVDEIFEVARVSVEVSIGQMSENE